METLLFVPYYARWHYTRGVRELVRNWVDFLWFLTEFFSLGLMLKTLFSPWERMGERYRGGFDFSHFVETFIVNVLMRVVGFVIRIGIVLFGIFALLLSIAFGIILLAGWIAFPFFILFLLALTMRNLFS